MQKSDCADGSGNSFAVAAYVTSYISKPDKFAKIGWRDILRELDTQIENIAEANKGKSHLNDTYPCHSQRNQTQS